MSEFAAPRWQTDLLQRLLDALLSSSLNTWLGRKRWRALLRSRHWLISCGIDALVCYPLASRLLRLPFSHELPILRKLHPHYLQNFSRLVAAVALKYPEAPAIDVGANVGDTAALFRQASGAPLLCVEGDPLMFGVLETNVVDMSAVLPLNVFIGQREQSAVGDLHRIKGTAYFMPGAGPVVSLPLAQVLAEHPQFASAHFFKLDTDGFDCLILQAERDWLARQRPVLFFEYDPAAFGRYEVDGFRTFEVLRAVGYRQALVWNNLGDYMLSVDLNNIDQLEDLHAFFGGRFGHAYADLAVFQAEDADLAEAVRKTERAFFDEFRRIPRPPRD